jgi:glycosyltransferase involved in cell wall biosynthesis/predicted ATP-grasp superfamily ATP-dependent carboligase
MRVLVLHSLYGSGDSSGENRVVESERVLLAEAGHAVRAWLPHAPGVDRPALVRAGLGAVHSRSAARTVRLLVRQHGSEVVHCHNLFPCLSPSVLAAAADEGAAVVMTLHNYRLLCLPATFLRGGHVCEDCLGHVPWRGVVHRCYRHSLLGSGALAGSLTAHRAADTFTHVHRFLAVSAFVRDKYVQAGFPAERILVKPNFVASTAVRDGAGDYFLFVGRLSPEKGVATLLEAHAPEHGRLLVVGDGPERERLEGRAGANVEFLGPVPSEAVAPLIARARALLMPSLSYEGAPRTLLEAYAAGVPVVASRIGALATLVEDGVTGILASPRDPKAWAAAMTRLLDDDESEQLGHRAHRLWRSQYEPERALVQLEESYRLALAAAGNGNGNGRPSGRATRDSAMVARRRVQPTLDVVLLDADERQSLVCMRSLGRTGLHVGAFGSARWSPAFGSRWCVSRGRLPDSANGLDPVVEAIVRLVEEHRPQVLITAHDGTIEALRQGREAIGARAFVALAPEPALATAVDKRKTFELAASLGVAVPLTFPVERIEDVEGVCREIGFPLVVKPIRSWVDGPRGGSRLTSSLVVDLAEARAASARAFAAGGSVVLQEWLTGSREAVSLLYADGVFVGRFAQVAHRMYPPLGGSSVVRESIPLPPDLLEAAEGLVATAGLEGYSEVEFRRDAAGRAHLMEINPRLSASVEVAVRAGVDFPLLLHAWAAGERPKPAGSYRTGVRMRWLGGDVRWLRDTIVLRGRPEVPPVGRALVDFAFDTLRPAGYDYASASDPRPMLVALTGFALKAARRGREKRAAARSGPVWT